MEQEVRIEALKLHEARRLALFRASMIYLLAAITLEGRYRFH